MEKEGDGRWNSGSPSGERSLPLGAVWKEALGGGVGPCTEVFLLWGLKNGPEQGGREENKGRKQ